MKYLAILIISLFIFGCNNTINDREGTASINLVENMNNKIDLTLSDFADEINYIPFETNPGCIIDQGAHVLAFEQFYLVGEGHQDLMKFDLQGNYLGIFAKYGQGPGEYSNINGLYGDEEIGITIIFDAIGKRLLYYNLSGAFLKSVEIPIRPSGLQMISPTLFVGELFYQMELNSKYYSYFIFDISGEITPLYSEKKRNKLYDIMVAPNFVKNNDIAYYIPSSFSDTLYQISTNKEITKTLLNKGDYGVPENLLYDQKIFQKEINRFIFFINVYPGHENNLFIKYYFEGSPYLGILNIEKNTLEMIKNLTDHKAGGVINDLDGGLEFIPGTKRIGNKWYRMIWPSELLELKDDKQFLKADIKNAETRARLLELLSGLKETDNPVIIEVIEKSIT